MNEELSSLKLAILEKLKKGQRFSKESIELQGLVSSPLSCSQQRIWFLEQLFPNTAMYNMYFAVRLLGEINLEILQKSVDIIINRHEILRVRICIEDGKPIQKIQSSSCPIIIIEDQEVERFIQVPFDLAQDNLLRIYLAHVNDYEQILLVVMHHIVSDGWSLGIFLKELSSIYASFIGNKLPDLKPLPIQYFDYIRWQEEYLQGKLVSNQIEYWKNHLGIDNEFMLDLPTDKPRFSIQTYGGKRCEVIVSKSLTEQIKLTCKKYQVTLFMFLIAAFKVLLCRYTSNTDIALGTPIANRGRKEFEDMIGFFVNTLIIRCDLSGDPTFVTLLERIRKVTTDAYSNQDLPFEKLVEIIQPKRIASGSPLFNVVFVLQNTINADKEFLSRDLIAEPFFIHNKTCKFDLLLTLVEYNEELRGAFEYSTDLFMEQTINQFCRHYVQLLDIIVKNPLEKIGSLDFLSAEDFQQTSSQVKIISPADKTICDIFTRQVRQFSDKVALKYGEETVTYKELDVKANQLARHLQNTGIMHGELVGISLGISFDLIISILGILKAGAGYIPLDPLSPSERVSFIEKDANLKLIINKDFLEKNREKIAQLSGDNLDVDGRANDIVYVIYTSGSTGDPKGVMVENRNLVRLFANTNHWFNFTSKDVWCLFHSYAFDFSVWEMFGALLYGGKLVLVPELTRKSFELFYDLLANEHVTILNQTPAAFKELMQVDKLRDVNKLSYLRFVIFGGAKLDIQSLKPWFDQHGDVRPKLVNMYGITETTVHVTYRGLTVADLQTTSSPIGEPIPDLRIHLLDKNLKPVPRGGVGEVYIEGAGVSRGYLNRPELTRERFIEGQLANGNRLYKTGDLAKYNVNMELEYVGRSDTQVKIRGFRLELGEIESRLIKHPLVEQAIVTLYKNEITEQLIAYVILNKKEAVKLAQNQIKEWHSVFNEYYDGGVENPDFNIKGWVSSYTREQIPDEEMKEWVESTVSRILALKPQKVLEIGCGTGLLLARIAPYCQEYYGTDMSEVALNFVKEQLIKDKKCFEHVKLFKQFADNPIDCENYRFDTFILNSVCQYFPNLDYLFGVISGVLPKINDGGTLFIGDVLDFTSADMFHKSIGLSMEQETELMIHPQFFYNLVRDLPRVTHVDVLYKDGKFHNEMNCFRYDVILYINFNDTDESEIVVRKNIVNSRVTKCAVDVDPKELFSEARQLNQCVKLIPSHGYNCKLFDAIFLPLDKKSLPIPKTMNRYPSNLIKYANNPVEANFHREWVGILQEHLKLYLPDYMIPTTFIGIDKFPITVNGKIDYRALPAPKNDRSNIYKEFVPPSTETEKKIADMFSKILGVSTVGRYDSFFDLGGHSLLATRLIFALQTMFVQKIPLHLVLLKPIVADLAQEIDNIDILDGDFHKQRHYDISKDVQLDAAIKSSSSYRGGRYKNILLTGATGFVGGFLLIELLKNTDAIIYCMVRANSIEDGLNRIYENLSQYLLWDQDLSARIKVVVGDLSSVFLGMNKPGFYNLSAIIDAIYHCGASVNFVYPYENLKASNVLGTQEILRLAVATKIKPVHFISTLYVFGNKDMISGDPIVESQLPKYWESLNLGYTRSKWVAENIIELGRKRGIPINIYRLGRVSGDSITGACQTNDFLWEIIRTGIKVGSLPVVDMPVEIAPVDITSRAIVALSKLDNINCNFHLFNVNSLAFNEFIEVLNSKGYLLKQEAPEVWHEKLMADESAAKLLPVVSQISQMEGYNTNTKFSNLETMQILAELKIKFPAVIDLLDTYINYFVKIGYFS